MWRCYFLTFSGEYRGPEDVHPHESPPVMTVPLWILAGLSVIGLVLALPPSWVHGSFLERWNWEHFTELSHDVLQCDGKHLCIRDATEGHGHRISREGRRADYGAYAIGYHGRTANDIVGKEENECVITATAAAFHARRATDRQINIEIPSASMRFARNGPGKEERAGAEDHLRAKTVARCIGRYHHGNRKREGVCCR